MASMALRARTAERAAVTVVSAACLAAADLALKAAIPTAPWYFHERSALWVAGSFAVLIAALALVRVPSRAVALGAGVMSGGVAGNLLSAQWNDNSVPNPLVLGDHVHGIAFNAADVFILFGNLLLISALIVVTIGHRDQLVPPREWARAVRRRL
jgi:hypothetical protein